MRKVTYTIALILITLFVGCTRHENGTPEPVKSWRQFTAHTDNGAATKTTLDGEVGDPQRVVKWSPDDTIGVTAYKKFEKFANMGADTSSTTTFQGYITEASRYYAVYPYNEETYMSSSTLRMYLPEVQPYCEGSFASGANPMVANISEGEELDFHNICGVLILRMKGDFTVKAVHFEAKDSLGLPMSVSGFGEVDMNYEDHPILIMNGNAGKMVTIDCGEGITLTSENETPFHLVLPPAVYHTFKITVVSTDGRIFIKEGKKPLVVSRSVAVKSGAFTPQELEYVDLSVDGTANSYIVSEAGMYSIDASVMGNGTLGGYLHTEEISITPASAEILWNDSKNPSLVVAVYDQGSKTIKFLATGEEGNALIAAKDGDGNVLWSWHIWCTDVPAIHKYVNSIGTFEVMDRNLGAIRGDRGVDNEWKESCGLEYQWGRKDPFAGGYLDQLDDLYGSVEESILNPTFIYGKWQGSEQYWHPDFKTLYDPCPVGYRVAPYQIWNGFSLEKVSGEFDNGWNFQYDSEGNTAWYPNKGEPTETGTNYWSNNYMISSSGASGHRDGIYFSSGSLYRIDNTMGALRCIRDNSCSNVNFPTVSLKRVENISATSAKVVCEVIETGKSDVMERGVVLGSVYNLTIENGKIYKCGEGAGEFTAEITELSPDTKYFVRSYAINEDGTGYSDVKAFATDSDGDILNLSVLEGANSYLITDNGFRKFIFDARYQGNTQIPIEGTPSSAGVLWETGSVEDTVSKGDIITSVSLREDGFMEISIPEEFTPGNALIAVLDPDSTVLWSWHIWVSEKIKDHIYKGDAGEFEVMDRNLGAMRADRGTGEQWRDAMGMMYQWGRKDPLVKDLVTIVKEQRSSIEYFYNHPTEYGFSFPGISDFKNTLWIEDQKHRYDPCPVGYRVASDDALSLLKTGAESGYDYDYGKYLIYDGINSAWFPATPYYDPSGNYCNATSYSYIWTDTGVKSMYTDYNSVYMTTGRSAGDSYPVRCMREEAVGSSKPTVEIISVTDTTTTSIKVSGILTNNGSSRASEYGLILGKKDGFTLEEAIITYKSDGESDVFTHTFTGLDEFGKYYVRGYAVNEYGTSYTKVYPFVTLFSGDLVDLSAEESANSYIVSSIGKYKFKVVRGNSGEEMPEGSTPSVLWESFNNNNLPKEGDLVDNVRYDNGYIYFDVYTPFNEGNASVGYFYYRDHGRCWSWHIWLTDEPQEHTYPDGTILMDRNLGALSAAPGEVESLGLMYQWGRKDPFMGSSFIHMSTNAKSTTNGWEYSGSVNSIEDAVVYPLTFLKRNSYNSDWLKTGNASTDTTRWGVEKTIYDPCPPGWRVADGGANGVWANSGVDSLSFDNGNKGVLIPTAEDGVDAWYPAAGYRNPDNYNLEKVGKMGGYWTASFGGAAPYDFVLSSGGLYPLDMKSAAYGQSVRCQKIE